MHIAPKYRPLLIAAAGLLVLPFVLPALGLTLTTATDVVLFAMACMGLNILVGHTGLVSFGHGAFFGLAGLCGVLLAPIVTIHPAMGAEILTAAFVVVVIGGLGSFWGVVAAALLVGVVRGLTSYFLPPASEASIYLLMVLVLLFRPRGLFGERIQKFE